MEHSSLTSLTVVMAVAFFTPIMLHRLRLKAIPVVVAEIIVGIMIGKTGFNIVQEDQWLNLSSLFGFIFLMFLSGLEIDFSVMKRKKQQEGKVNPLLAAMIIFVFIFGLSYALSYTLVQFHLISDTFLMTIIISTVSLGVVVPVLKENQLTETPFGQTILLIAVISDFLTMILLAIYVSSLSGEEGHLFLLIVFFGLVVLVYRFIRRFNRIGLFEVLRKGTVQLGTRGVFALILVLVVLSESFGVESILGAFLAGVMVSLLGPNKEFVHQLESFGYGFLIPIFFVMVGVNLDIRSLFDNPQSLTLIPILLVFLYLSKIVPALLLKKWFTWRQAFGSGVLITSTLSLVIAASMIALELGIISEELNSTLVLVAILTCFISPVVFNKLLPPGEKDTVQKVAIIGNNNITLSVASDLEKEGFQVNVIPSLTDLEKSTAHKSNILVLGTTDDELNMSLARQSKDIGMEKVVVRIENLDNYEKMHEEGFIVFSTLFASRSWLKALIEHPGAVELITKHEETIQEIKIKNMHYNGSLIRDLPKLGNALILRVYRANSSIIPHGDTVLEVDDRLLISGDVEDVQRIRSHLE